MLTSLPTGPLRSPKSRPNTPWPGSSRSPCSAACSKVVSSVLRFNAYLLSLRRNLSGLSAGNPKLGRPYLYSGDSFSSPTLDTP